MGAILIMHNYNVLDGLDLYIYSKVYNVGSGNNVYDFVKVLSIIIYKLWTI